ncbi:type II toxin-antitoxin system VapB family antitoxin [Microvirga sp. 2TAF3]|uniref:type II toxin-antitoxin system VapB family antitoxin n=1 Tax=Microvirga sp. 2TAF3 TaxID=3233014 RepID=UPI003F9DD6AC
MSYLIRDEAVLRSLRGLAKRRKATVADVLRTAVDREIAAERDKLTVHEKLAPVLARIREISKPSQTTIEEQKKYFDDLWGEDDVR